jgi:hypothetical protein
VARAAVPATTGTEPRPDAPSKNVTDPVGVPGNDDDTEAVKVTDSPATEGLLSETRVVVVVPCTNWLSVDEVLVSNVAFPLYVALRLCVPNASPDVLRLATAERFSAAVPSEPAPS